ncbi:copper chaperone PCu(A)C [Streptomyces mirabilis]|uniref:copper chaperone PCu(A)C n=1 Tax=Streptomyces TaxID=1883 RepID=UPI0009CBA8E9|nr:MULTISPECIES: copper chaperone PCu(A)C [Streptomyces]MCX4422987.1 copper chaperone PCu(A)C [Streptomyces mirabilis]MCZ0999998.1 copper chaperone PCu(A)C [Streptomyces mirabilis]
MSRPGAPSRRLAGCVALTATALALAGCGSDDSPSNKAGKPEMKITGAYMPAPVMDTMAAGFFIVTNSGGADTLTSVTSDLASDVTLHSTKGGAMEEQKSFAVPADGSLDFASGGNHLMFEKLTHKPMEGEKVSVTLHFTKAGAVKVSMPVKSATYNPKTGH